MKIIQAAVHFQIGEVQKLIPDAMSIVHNLGKCNLKEMKTAADFCFEDFERCSPQKIMTNV